MGIEPSDITMPELKEEEKPQDGVYNGVPSFCTAEDGEICTLSSENEFDERQIHQKMNYISFLIIFAGMWLSGCIPVSV